MPASQGSDQQWWRGLDSNQRRLSQRIYSPSPLTTRAPLHDCCRSRAASIADAPNEAARKSAKRLMAIGSYPVNRNEALGTMFCVCARAACVQIGSPRRSISLFKHRIYPKTAAHFSVRCSKYLCVGARLDWRSDATYETRGARRTRSDSIASTGREGWQSWEFQHHR